MIEFFKNASPQFIIGLLMVAGGVLLWLWGKRDSIGGALASLGGGTTDEDVLDLQAVRRLEKRAERLDCAEMKAGVKQVKDHFFHEGA